MNDRVKSVIKAVFVLQLRHGAVSEEELERSVGAVELEHALGTGYLVMDDGTTNRRRRISLTAKGRGEIKVVLAGGVYDVLHVGHVAALCEARRLGDVLVAVVATDATVEMMKGRRPVFPEEDRRALVEGLKPVDRAILGYEDVGMGYQQVLLDVLPDIVVFGYDQERLERSVSEIIKGGGLSIRTVRLSKYDREKYISSTAVRERLYEKLK